METDDDEETWRLEAGRQSGSGTYRVIWVYQNYQSLVKAKVKCLAYRDTTKTLLSVALLYPCVHTCAHSYTSASLITQGVIF